MRIDLTLCAPDGTCRDVAVLAPAGTATAELAARLAPYAPSGLGGLRVGVRLQVDGGAPQSAVFGATHRLDVVSGPNAGHSLALGRAPVTIGRAADCDLVLSDPAVSHLHAEVALSPTGPTVRDRGSTNGTTVDGVPAASDPQPVPNGRYVRVGDSFLDVTATPTPPALTRPGPSGTLVVNRPPRATVPNRGGDIHVPSRPASSRPQRIGWITALIPAAAGVALALSLHAPQFLLFALLSPITVLATAFGDRLHWRRERRQGRAHYRRELAASNRRLAQALTRETRLRRSRDPDPAAVLRTAELPGVRLWERSRGADLLRVRLGLKPVQSLTRVDDGTGPEPGGILPAVPVAVDLAEGSLGLAGPRDVVLGIARWVVGQLATTTSPVDLELALVLSAETERSWRWTRWLPQLRGRVALDPDEHRALIAELLERQERRRSEPRTNGRWPGPWVVLVVDGQLTSRAGLAELLGAGPGVGVTALCLDARPGGLPSECVNVGLVTGETGSRLRLGPAGEEGDLIADQVTSDWAERVARALASLHDPGDGRAEGLPDACDLLTMIGLPDPTGPLVQANWAESGRGLPTVLGLTADGPLSIDLVRDGPHALIAGTTGAGKSELLRTLVAGLAARHSPEAVAFVLVDYKGGAAFADCARLPHTVGLVTDLDPHLAERALRSLERELTRREELFADSGARDLEEYRAARPDDPTPRLVIVIDEFAELAAELGEFVSGLVGVARRGRSLGVHLVLATQRPSGVVSPEIRANTALRIALRVTDPSESRDVIDADEAASLSRRQPGRAYLRLPGAPTVRLQTARVGASASVGSARTPRVVPLGDWRRLPRHCEPEDAKTDLQALVEAARDAAARSGRPRPRSPWLPPLPERIAISDLTDPADLPGAGDPAAGPIPLGLCDRPREQRQSPLLIDLDGGGLLLAGAPRTGRTSALLTLAITAATDWPPDRLQVYALDCAGGGLAPLARLPHCGSVVGADIASTARLITRLDAEVAERRRLLSGQPDTVMPRILCMLDGWDSFVAAADEHDAGRTVDTLCGLLRTGPSVGLTVAITGDRGALSVRLSSAVPTKLLLRLTDRVDYGLLGLKERDVPLSPPPGRAVRAEDGIEVQLAHLGADPSPGERDRALEHAVRRWATPATEPATQTATWTSVSTSAGPADGSGAGRRRLIRVRPLPDQVQLSTLTPAIGPGAILGVGGDAAEPLAIELFVGARRLLVAGPPRSGRTTVLRSLAQQLAAQRCRILVAAPPRSPLTALARTAGLTLVTPDVNFGPTAAGRRTLLLMDDSETFLDTAVGDALTDWVRSDPPGVAVVAAGSSDELAVCFRGVAAEVRRARVTLLLQPGPGDADLAGVALTRRRTGEPAGRGLLVGDPAWGPQFTAGPLPIQVVQP